MSIIDPSHHIYLWHKKPHKVLFKKGRSPILMSYDPGINTTNITWADTHTTKSLTFVQTEVKRQFLPIFLAQFILFSIDSKYPCNQSTEEKCRWVSNLWSTTNKDDQNQILNICFLVYYASYLQFAYFALLSCFLLLILQNPSYFCSRLLLKAFQWILFKNSAGSSKTQNKATSAIASNCKYISIWCIKSWQK